ncbi:hypothetical protein ETB55_21925 [Salmonella enterica subsp. enterica serovar Omuna]|nr:hypothetical protein [Salmonella enterica subsp. enterica serovar Omuna]
MNRQINYLIQLVQSRSRASKQAGGDGFTPAAFLHFDTGLSAQTVQRALMKEVALGKLEHVSRGRGEHYYRQSIAEKIY